MQVSGAAGPPASPRAIYGAGGEADMKKTDTTLAVKRFRLEEARRRMATMDAMKSDLERKLADLESSVAREKQRANDSDIGRLALPTFLRSIDARRENLRATLKEIERERASCQQDLDTAAQELKAVELAQEQQARRQAEQEERRVQARLEEAAMIRHLRKHAYRRA
jgi:flagellar protein FliJ